MLYLVSIYVCKRVAQTYPDTGTRPVLAMMWLQEPIQIRENQFGLVPFWNEEAVPLLLSYSAIDRPSLFTLLLTSMGLL